jgi:superfamily II DNA or RNA helicase
MSTAPRKLRDYQEITRSRVHAEWSDEINRTAIVLPTGAGKTDIVSQLCLDEIASGGRVLVLAHRSELIDQLIERINAYTPATIGRIQAGWNDLNLITAASVQTLRRPKRMAAIAALHWQPTLVVIDEVHHALAESYLAIAEWAGCFDARRTRLLGVTATLIRGDRQAFDGLFQSVADVITKEWAIKAGILVPAVIKPIKLTRFTDRFRFRSLSDKQLERQDCRRIVEDWQRRAADRITIAYCASIGQAECLVDAFTEADVPVGLVIGTTPYEDREVIYKKLATGDIRVMVNVGVATEGFDCPAVSCILLDRYTENAGLLTQMIGRGIRPYIDPTTGQMKTECLVLDSVEVTSQFRHSVLMDINPRCVRVKQPSRFRRLFDTLRGK